MLWSRNGSISSLCHGPATTTLQECKVPGSDLELPFVCPSDRFIDPSLMSQLPVKLPGFLAQLQVVLSIIFNRITLNPGQALTA